MFAAAGMGSGPPPPDPPKRTSATPSPGKVTPPSQLHPLMTAMNDVEQRQVSTKQFSEKAMAILKRKEVSGSCGDGAGVGVDQQTSVGQVVQCGGREGDLAFVFCATCLLWWKACVGLGTACSTFWRFLLSSALHSYIIVSSRRSRRARIWNLIYSADFRAHSLL